MVNNNEDPLVVRGKIKMSDGKPSDHRATVTLHLIDDKSSDLIPESAVKSSADDQGVFEFNVDLTGFQQIWNAQGQARFHLDATADPQLSDETTGKFNRSQRRVTNITLTFPGNSTGDSDPDGRGPDYTGLLNEAIDVITNLGGRATSATIPRPAGSGQDLDRFFDDAVLKVLGTRVRPDQPDELLSAFDRVFVETEIEGRSVVEYRGTSGTATLPTEPGQISSGPQAVLYRRASAELGSVKQALSELAADIDDRQDEFEAVRDVIDHKLTELVEVLGQDVRLPVSRVESIFKLLLGPKPGVAAAAATAEKPYLTQLRELIGFEGGGLVDPNDMTRDEDRASTRYLEIQFYVDGLRTNWNRIVDEFHTPGSRGPLGSRLDLLNLQLDRLAEVTDDLDISLTADSIDSAEREFLFIKDSPQTSMSELMDWLWDFARTSKSFDSQKGITAVKATAGEIDSLVTSALEKFSAPKPQPGFRSRQVRRALEDVKSVLGAIQTI
jgi:hypothetical protein